VASEKHTGPICPCGHPVAGHTTGGCLDIQWLDETSEVWCYCDLDQEAAGAVGMSDAPSERAMS